MSPVANQPKKKWPLWLKWGLGIGAINTIVALLFTLGLMRTYFVIFPYYYIFSYPMFLLGEKVFSCFSQPGAEAPLTFSPIPPCSPIPFIAIMLIEGVVLGAVIGFIIQKLKKRKATNNPVQ